MKQLRILILNFCRIRKLPADLFNLNQLVYFDVSYNCLSELPDSIGQCKSLNFLNISGNEIRQRLLLYLSESVIAWENSPKWNQEWLFILTEYCPVLSERQGDIGAQTAVLTLYINMRLFLYQKIKVLFFHLMVLFRDWLNE